VFSWEDFFTSGLGDINTFIYFPCLYPRYFSRVFLIGFDAIATDVVARGLNLLQNRSCPETNLARLEVAALQQYTVCVRAYAISDSTITNRLRSAKPTDFCEDNKLKKIVYFLRTSALLVTCMVFLVFMCATISILCHV